ncbi:MAG: hypothetical protein PHO32_04225 [Candidatus Cloacimonetes bacterium]|nr:hypothetical protein [Candidatus Cloacimonadota bacterium]
MIIALRMIQDIETTLNIMLRDARIEDYRIVFLLNYDISVFVKANKEITLDVLPYFDNSKVKYEQYTDCEVINDPYLDDKFEENIEKISVSVRRRFDNLLSHKVQHIKTPFPVISFYSYKGGTGRTTSLALFASHYAMHYKKKVVILDCDFEAPGFNNYFDISEDILTQKQGVVEYLNDVIYFPDLDVENYSIRVSSKFSGDGTIIVFPAGNLTQGLVDENNSTLKTHFDHYLEALSRTNFSGRDFMQTNMLELLNKINTKYAPDVLLIDNRTGFNDIYSNLSLTFSSMIIGFFGSNAQTVPGFESFIHQVFSKNIRAIVVNSIISDIRYHNDFLKHIYEPTIQILSNENIDPQIDSPEPDSISSLEETLQHIPVYPLYRIPRLEVVGCANDDGVDFVSMIKSKTLSEYTALFESIILNTGIGNSENHDIESHIENDISDEQHEKIIEIPNQPETTIESKPINGIKEVNVLKKGILEEIEKNFPKGYTEDLNVNDDFIKRCLFYRECMTDILNRDKFLVVGNKGTGKTLIYRAFTRDTFIELITKKYGVNKNDYIFINIIAIHKGDARNGIIKFIDDSVIDNQSTMSSDIFYRRFWMLYIWNSILIEPVFKSWNLESKLDVMHIKPDEETAKRFKSIIMDDESMIQVENELKSLDNYLAAQKNFMVISFDELDHVFKPHTWDQTVSPLITYMRNNQFSNIIPKVFIRSDLYRKLANLTNKEQLQNRMINIEWNSEELFGFFFKTLFALGTAKQDFFAILKHEYKADIDQVIKLENMCNNFNMPTDKKHVSVLVTTFFGKWADYRGSTRYGLSYDWFYTNLKNADGSISLRPFIDLIRDAVHYALNNEDFSKHPILPILHQVYYTHPESRVAAVKTHINDLSKETGNKDIEKVFNFIRLEAPKSLRKFNLLKHEFDMLLNLVIKRYGKELENTSIDSLRDVLINNGIITVFFKPGGYTMYSYAFLYKYYLGLGGRDES